MFRAIVVQGTSSELPASPACAQPRWRLVRIGQGPYVPLESDYIWQSCWRSHIKNCEKQSSFCGTAILVAPPGYPDFSQGIVHAVLVGSFLLHDWETWLFRVLDALQLFIFEHQCSSPAKKLTRCVNVCRVLSLSDWDSQCTSSSVARTPFIYAWPWSVSSCSFLGFASPGWREQRDAQTMPKHTRMWKPVLIFT